MLHAPQASRSTAAGAPGIRRRLLGFLTALVISSTGKAQFLDIKTTPCPSHSGCTEIMFCKGSTSELKCIYHDLAPECSGCADIEAWGALSKVCAKGEVLMTKSQRLQGGASATVATEDDGSVYYNSAAEGWTAARFRIAAPLSAALTLQAAVFKDAAAGAEWKAFAQAKLKACPEDDAQPCDVDLESVIVLLPPSGSNTVTKTISFSPGRYELDVLGSAWVYEPGTPACVVVEPSVKHELIGAAVFDLQFVSYNP